MRRAVVNTLVLLLSACGTPTSDPAEPPEDADGKADGAADELPAKTPKRIILLIGDGMGLGAISGATYAKGDPLAMLTMEHAGFMTTHEHEFVTTDSAASATAIASGVKTHFGAVGVVPGTDKEGETETENQVTTVVDVAESAGWRTGLIATTSVVDATPAAFAAHRASRKSKDSIALDLSSSGVDVLIGGGRKNFDDRSDDRDLIDEMRDAGYSTASTALGLKRHSGSKTQVVALLHEKDMPPVVDGDREMELPVMVDEAITILDTENDAGWFLMVEGSQIDRRAHEMKGPDTIAETLDFDAAVEVALEYARSRDDTLVVVTADHETAGLTILDPKAAEPLVEALGGDENMNAAADFSGGGATPVVEAVELGEGSLVGPEARAGDLLTAFGDMSIASRPFWFGPSFLFRASHTSTMVPVLAEGTAAEFLVATRDNADLGGRLRALIAADGGDEQTREEPEENDPTNVVLVVSDMVGLPALTAAHYTVGELVVEGLPVRGLVGTAGHDAIVAGASASATALSTGFATRRGAVGVVPDEDELVAAQTLLRAAQAADKQTALVTTADLTAPEVAAWYAGGAGDFAGAMVNGGLDLVFAGGRDAFDADLVDAWEQNGATVETSWSADVPTGTTVRLLADEALELAGERAGANQPSLGEMTRAALDGLDDEGFFAVVYADEVGRLAQEHARGPELSAAVSDLDGAVEAALDFADGRDDTLVVVVSLRDSTMSVIDNHYGFHVKHCGVTDLCDGPETLHALGIAVGEFDADEGLDDAELQGDFAPPAVFVQSAWITTRAHRAGGVLDPGSANHVPLFAAGAGAKAFGGFQTLATIGVRLGAIVSR